MYRAEMIASLKRSKETAQSNLDLLKKQAASIRNRAEEQIKLSSDFELKIADGKMKLKRLTVSEAPARSLIAAS